MKPNLERDLKEQNSSWSPSSDNVQAMMARAHQQAHQIKRRRVAVSALSILCAGSALIYSLTSTQDPTPEGKPPRAIVQVEEPTQPTPKADTPESNTKQQLQKEDRQFVMALVNAQSFAMEDFDFIEDTLTSPYEDYLNDL